MDKTLELINVKKSYEKFDLDVSFDIEPGYIMGFIGPNGAGKTTTIKLIMNLAKKNSGKINIFGKDNVDFEEEVKQDIGFVYDEPAFYDRLPIKKMTNIYKPFYKNWDEEKYQKFLQIFELDEEKKISTLSKGTKMKYALALALAHNPKLVIMDEPTAGLDPVIRREILQILQEIVAKYETTIFFSTHLTSDLDKIADYITFINDGSIVFSKEKDMILDEYHLVKGGNDYLNDEVIKSFIGYKKTDFGFEALSKNTGYGDSVIIERPTLEDIMYYHNKKALMGGELL